jgi:hypothetical protein
LRSSSHKSSSQSKSRARQHKILLSKEEEINQQKEQWTNMSLVDRGGMTRKKYQLQQRLLALNPRPKKKFQDRKKYGISSKDGKPQRGDPGGLKALLRAKKMAQKLKQARATLAKAKGAKAKSRWGKLKFANKFAKMMGGGGSGGKQGNDGSLDTVEEDEEEIVVDDRPTAGGVKLDHPKRVSAFVDGQKNAGRSRKEALTALRKLTPSAHATTKPTAFFTAADALVARAGIMKEILPPESQRVVELGSPASQRSQ